MLTQPPPRPSTMPTPNTLTPARRDRRVGKAFMLAQAHAQAAECFRMALELDPHNARVKQLFLEVLDKLSSQQGPEKANKQGGDDGPGSGVGEAEGRVVQSQGGLVV